MVKPDPKQNYYADLEVPVNASVEDIKRAYKKLALQYHPDRNAGREAECVSKFQAINTAHEVLADPTLKAKYDTDRRKYGQALHAVPRQQTTGHPYPATSAYPPPPRRTQPGTWQRPQPGFGVPTGAERYANFPRQPPTAKKDPPVDRENVYRAWQHMNTQERQQRANPPNQPPPPPQSQPQPQPQANRARFQPPPPRQAPPGYDADTAEKRQSAWSAFQQANAGKPGMSRSNTMRTPNKKGFNPNAPTSDEKAAPGAGAHYVHRNKSADFGQKGPNVNVPPTSVPPQYGTAPTTPRSPDSPLNRRPNDPLRQAYSRGDDNSVPYAEANRQRTPYTSFIGEKTQFSDGLRRSFSTHDSTKLSPEQSAKAGRARSTSPPRRTQPEHHNPSFDFYSSNESSSGRDESDNNVHHAQERPGTAPNATDSDGPFRRPHGPNANGTQANGNHPDMRQKSGPTMYADPSSPPSPPQAWTERVFGFDSTSNAKRRKFTVPKWAIPSSVNPSLRRERQVKEDHAQREDQTFKSATEEERKAYLRFHAEVTRSCQDRSEYVPRSLDMKVFLQLVQLSRDGIATGSAVLDELLPRIVLDFPTVGTTKSNFTDQVPSDSFSSNHDQGAYESTNAKSRSEETINTNFGAGGWKGSFTGEPDDSAPPINTSRKQASPARRTTGKTAKSQTRSSTMDVPPTSAPPEEMPQRPWGSDGTPNEYPRPAPSGQFNSQEWEHVFKDPSWTQPATGGNPPSPGKSGTAPRKSNQGRKASKAAGKKTAGTKQHPFIVEDEDSDTGDSRADSGGPVHDDVDAMDIDSPPAPEDDPPVTATPQQQGARTYAVPRSAWREQQEQKLSGHQRKSSNTSRHHHGSIGKESKFTSNLDDLRHVEPIGPSADKNGGFNVSDLGATLPFTSKASEAVFSSSVKPSNADLSVIPVVPQPPQRLTKSSFHDYAAQFNGYLIAYHRFNRAALEYFASHERQAEEQMSKGTGWLEATGDTSGMITAPTGFGIYLRGIPEQERMRMTWNVACDRHAEAVKGFQNVRERVRKLVIGGTLMDN